MNDTLPAPPVWKWYVAYCALMALLYLAVTGCSAIFLVVNPAQLEMSPVEAKIIGLGGGVLGLMLFIPYAVAPFLPQRPWAWIVGLVLIGIGMTSTCFLPIAVPLLIFWIKPETKRYFGRAE